jgi:hypothetical membrane protein
MHKIQEGSGAPSRLYGICGIIAPIFFALMVIVESSVVTGYNQVSQQISDLGASALYGSYSLLQNLNFGVFGILIIALAVGLRRALPASRAFSWSLSLFGVLVFLAGVFQDQPSPWPGGVHALIAVTAFVSIILSQFFSWRTLRRSTSGQETGWSRYARFSLITLVLSVIMFVLNSIFYGSSIGGLVQRVFLTVAFLWIEGISLLLLRFTGSHPKEPRPL